MSRKAKRLAAAFVAVVLISSSACGTSTIRDPVSSTDASNGDVVLGWHSVNDGAHVPLPPGDPIASHEWDESAPWRLTNFWASTCGPCKREIPILNDASKIDDLQVLGVSRDQFKKYAIQFEEEVGASFPSWLDSSGEYQNKFSQSFPQNALPISLLSYRGKLVAVHVGPIDSLAEVDGYVKSPAGHP